MNKPILLVISNTNLGNSLSGGDRIFLNIIKYWKNKFKIEFLACQEAANLASRFKLNPNTRLTSSSSVKSISLNTTNLFFHHLKRFITGTFFCLKNSRLFKESQYIYTSSDFYGDFIFGIIAKIINPNIVWLCGYYLLAPKPKDKNSPYNQTKHPIRGLIYFLAQIPTIYFARLLADYVFVTSLPDVHIFKSKRLPADKIMIVQGGVFLPNPQAVKDNKKSTERKYDALYIGRLHSQKGVLELIDIWKKVVSLIPSAKLAIIGDGELLDDLVKKININGLTKNIKLIGFCIGAKKFKIIKESKIIVHPATYDSGGMAAAEAMAWGLPGVSFDLPALRTYYPKGMIKTPCFNYGLFSKNIIKLLTNKKLYQKYSDEALELTRSEWNWKTRLNNIYLRITNNI